MPVKAKAIDLLPGWLQRLYATLGEPPVAPRQWDAGVRFFDGDRTITRRSWTWWHNRRHYKLQIDQYRDSFKTVAEKETAEGYPPSITDIRIEVDTQLYPTDGQLQQILDLAGFHG